MATYERIWGGTAKSFVPKTQCLGGEAFFCFSQEVREDSSDH
jgi:hypothetical protein